MNEDEEEYITGDIETECDCGSGLIATWGTNPYSVEIHDDYEEQLMCEKCRQEASDDI